MVKNEHGSIVPKRATLETTQMPNNKRTGKYIVVWQNNGVLSTAMNTTQDTKR